MTITKDGRVVSLPSDLVPGLRSSRKFLSLLLVARSQQVQGCGSNFGEGETQQVSGNGGHNREMVALHRVQIAGPSGLSEARQSSSPRRKQAPRKVGMDRQEK